MTEVKKKSPEHQTPEHQKKLVTGALVHWYPTIQKSSKVIIPAFRYIKQIH
jgi:hypothetical protein